MSFIHGHQCDGPNCQKIEGVSLDANADALPDGWFNLTLPGTLRDSQEDKQRAFCSAACLAEFAIERDGVDNAVKRRDLVMLTT